VYPIKEKLATISFTGLEPALHLEIDFKSIASTYSAKRTKLKQETPDFFIRSVINKNGLFVPSTTTNFNLKNYNVYK
jgi:hypothetical protein